MMAGGTMARYALNLPTELKREAEEAARMQGVSLNQFVLWSVAEKVGALKGSVDDPQFPGVTYRCGASFVPTPVLRGTGIRVQTISIALSAWRLSPEEVARQYSLPLSRINEATAFYKAHRAEIDALISMEEALDPGYAKAGLA